jgi:hypothetical protein
MREMATKMLDTSLPDTGEVGFLPYTDHEQETDKSGMTIGRVILIPVTAKLGHSFSVQV